MQPPAIVIDNGTGLVKAGFAGTEAPKSIFPSIIGSPKSTVQMVGGQNKEYFAGFEAMAKSDLLNMRQPIEDGTITNWDDMEKLWNHTFYNELLVVPEDHAVVLTEKPLCPRNNREKMIQMMFETFNVKGFYSGVQAVFSLFSLGRTTGMVWDAGEGVFFTVPVYEGYSLPHAILRSSMSGLGLTNLLKSMIVKTGIDETVLKQTEVQKIKEKYCRVTFDYQAEIQKTEQGKIPRIPISMPDNISVSLGPELFQCPEALFSPSIAGSNTDGIHQQIITSLERCDADVKKEMYSSIQLTGGTSMLGGLPERLEKEIIAIATTPSLKVKVMAPPERKNAVWIGGSIFGSLDQFPYMMIDKSEYREEGPKVVHHKCYG